MSQFWHAFAADLYRQVPDSDSARVIIFHPVLPYKRFVLSRLLTDSVYVRLHGQGLDVDAVRHQIDLMVAHQKPPPGKSLVVDEGDRIEAAAFMDYVRDFLSSSYFVRLFIFLRTLHAELDTALGAGGIRRSSCCVILSLKDRFSRLKNESQFWMFSVLDGDRCSSMDGTSPAGMVSRPASCAFS